MSTMTKNKTTKTRSENLEGLPLPELWARFKEATGESTKSPNKRFIVRRIEEALGARATEPEPAQATPLHSKRNARASEPVASTTEPRTTTASVSPKAPRGRFATMTIEELQAKYIEVVQRPSDSVDRRYLCWKIREAEKGRIPIGPRSRPERTGEGLDVKILPLRLEGDVVERVDAAWRSRGIRSRTEFVRRALDHYLAHLATENSDASVLGH